MADRPTLILVIDDSEDIRELLQLTFEAAGHRVRVAADGSEGLSAIREQRPDLILTDISMPGMNGFEFLIRLRSDFAPPLPPAIVVSGFDTVTDEAVRLGAARFVAKPFEAAKLVEIVEQVLHGQPADNASAEEERSFVGAARARAEAAAQRLFARLAPQSSRIEHALPRFAERISDYFAFGGACVLFAERGGIRVASVSRGSSLQAGMTFSGNLLFSTGVLAAGSSLVVTDSACHFGVALHADPRALALGFNFLVAVPLVYNGVPIGALCLFAEHSEPFEAEDLLTLEGIGRNIAQALEVGDPLGDGIGLVSPLFDRMLAAELSLLHKQRGSLDLLFVEIAHVESESDLVVELTRRLGARAAVCHRDRGTLAIYKRAPDFTSGQDAVSMVHDVLVAQGLVHASGWVSIVDADLPLVSGDVAMRLALLALEESQGSRNGEVRRLMIGSVAQEALRASAR